MEIEPWAINCNNNPFTQQMGEKWLWTFSIIFVSSNFIKSAWEGKRKLWNENQTNITAFDLKFPHITVDTTYILQHITSWVKEMEYHKLKERRKKKSVESLLSLSLSSAKREIQILVSLKKQS